MLRLRKENTFGMLQPGSLSFLWRRLSTECKYGILCFCLPTQKNKMPFVLHFFFKNIRWHRLRVTNEYSLEKNEMCKSTPPPPGDKYPRPLKKNWHWKRYYPSLKHTHFGGNMRIQRLIEPANYHMWSIDFLTPSWRHHLKKPGSIRPQGRC